MKMKEKWQNWEREILIYVDQEWETRLTKNNRRDLLTTHVKHKRKKNIL